MEVVVTVLVLVTVDVAVTVEVGTARHLQAEESGAPGRYALKHDGFVA